MFIIIKWFEVINYNHINIGVTQKNIDSHGGFNPLISVDIAENIRLYNEYVIKNRWVYDPARGLKITCKTPQIPDSLLRKKGGQFFKVDRSQKQGYNDSDDSGSDSGAEDVVTFVEPTSVPKNLEKRRGSLKAGQKTQAKTSKRKRGQSKSVNAVIVKQMEAKVKPNQSKSISAVTRQNKGV